jgi:acetyl-CoA carboxylase biotin carboxylase subunit
MFQKILVANRGEIALRVIRACKELGIATVAVYSEADADSLHVQAADEAVCIGPGPGKDSYLNIPNVIMAAIITGAEAIHPGYGYLSERASFAEACEASGLVFIGPPPSAIEKMGDKAVAREIVRHAKVPVVPGTHGAVRSEQEALKQAQRIGYPVLVKAVAGGGGKGIRLAENADELSRVLQLAQSEAQAAFGSPEVYVEKFIPDPRHVEVQVLADSYGNVIHLGERECSIQTARRQKMVEEAPASVVAPALRQKMGEAAVRAAKAVGYVNAGTVEFLLDSKGNFYFIEMNTRIQVEHPVTEQVTGVDIVREQIRIAAKERLRLTQRDVQWRGHSIECRLTAEDPDNDFAPSVGKITHLVLPGGPGVRVDTHLYPGYVIPPYYDSLLAKIIVWAEDRPSAIARMKRALEETRVEGVKTNLSFLKRIIDHPEYQKGNVSTQFLRRYLRNGTE